MVKKIGLVVEHRYGNCIKCSGACQIPGLDWNYCSKCGWVEDPISAKERMLAEEEKKAAKKTERAIKKKAGKQVGITEPHNQNKTYCGGGGEYEEENDSEEDTD